MSHFKRIKTKINNLTTLQKTLRDLGYSNIYKTTYITDLNGNKQLVDIVAEDKAKNLIGFSWDGKEYNIIADLQMWNTDIPFDYFFSRMLQKYALNSITQTSMKEGFEEINKQTMNDGSIKLVLQRWS